MVLIALTELGPVTNQMSSFRPPWWRHRTYLALFHRCDDYSFFDRSM